MRFYGLTPAQAGINEPLTDEDRTILLSLAESIRASEVLAQSKAVAAGVRGPQTLLEMVRLAYEDRPDILAAAVGMLASVKE